MSQRSKGQENEAEHHAEPNDTPLDVGLFEHLCHAASSNVYSSVGGCVDDDVQPEPSCDPSVVQHQTVHSQTGHDRQGGPLTCHQNEQRKLRSAKDGGSIGEVTANLITLAGGTRIKSVVIAHIQVVERYEGKKVDEGQDEDDNGFATQGKLKSEPPEEGQGDD